MRVVFAPGVDESERRELLASHGLTDRRAARRMTASSRSLFPDGTDRAAIVAALKQDPRIRLVTSPPVSERAVNPRALAAVLIAALLAGCASTASTAGRRRSETSASS